MFKRWIEKMYAWGRTAAHHRLAVPLLGLWSFAEASFFPLPVDMMLVPLVLARKKRWFYLAMLTTLTSVLGALGGYFIGMVLYDAVAVPLIDLYHLETHMAAVSAYFDKGAFIAVLISAFTPIPFKIFTIAGGIFGVNIIPFVIASLLGRGARYIIEAAISQKAERHIRAYKHPIAIIITLALVVLGVFLILR